MKKLINSKETIVKEMIEGLISAFPNDLETINELPIIVRKKRKKGKVALISGGGSGHEPSHAGFVGYGMLDAAVAGEIFTSPSADKVYEAIKAVDTGEGVLLIIKNYSGDVMNFEMAAELAQGDGIKIGKVVVNDDIAVENSTYTVGRRGVAGTIFVHKILGAASEDGYSLEKLEELGQKVVNNTKTFGMSLTPCTVFTTGKSSFDLEDDEIEIGLGIHGEPGVSREKFKDAHTHVNFLVDKLLKEIEIINEKVAVLINGLGETTLIELFIINNSVAKILKDKNIVIEKTLVGNYMTSLDMGGFSISLLKLDDEIERFLKAKSDTIALKTF